MSGYVDQTGVVQDAAHAAIGVASGLILAVGLLTLMKKSGFRAMIAVGPK